MFNIVPYPVFTYIWTNPEAWPDFQCVLCKIYQRNDSLGRRYISSVRVGVWTWENSGEEMFYEALTDVYVGISTVVVNLIACKEDLMKLSKHGRFWHADGSCYGSYS